MLHLFCIHSLILNHNELYCCREKPSWADLVEDEADENGSPSKLYQYVSSVVLLSATDVVRYVMV